MATTFRTLSDIEPYAAAKEKLHRAAQDLAAVEQRLAELPSDVDSSDEVEAAASSYNAGGSIGTLADTAAMIAAERQTLLSQKTILQAAKDSQAAGLRDIKKAAVRELSAERRPVATRLQMIVVERLRSLADAVDDAYAFRHDMNTAGLSGSFPSAFARIPPAAQLRQDAAAIQRIVQ